jgi:NNP family nitrate/nitrite transporter-like MFS transporter
MSKEDTAPLRVLVLSTTAFTLLFAVWLMFGVLGIPVRKELGLSDEQFGWLTATAILSGALPRLLFGVWADRFGGRVVMTALLLATAVPTALVAWATSYWQLLALSALFGLAGNSFTAGIAWNSAWAEPKRQGFALGVFGAGNVGASVTKLIGPGLIAVIPAAGFLGGAVPGGWRFIPLLYAVLLVAMAAALWFGTPSDDRRPGRGRPWGDLMRPLRFVRVWRFSLYYVVVFGAYVALSVWLPKYYVDVYGQPLGTAALLTALFIFPASLLRPLGGWLSDRYGARVVTYSVFIGIAVAGLPLSLPASVLPLDVWSFTALVFVVGVGMGVGKASVYKYIPQYFPRDVGAVGGMVGLLGALGGFFLPPLFAKLAAATGIPQMTFAVVTGLAVVSLAWLHLAVLSLRRGEPAVSPLAAASAEAPLAAAAAAPASAGSRA